MKLKLELQDGVTVLRVTEELGSAQVAVLKAGLAKILSTASAKKGVIVDLSEAQVDPAGEAALLQLRGVLPPDSTLVFAGPQKAVAQAATVAEAKDRLTSILADLSGAAPVGAAPMTAEEKLKHRLRQLESQKSAILGRTVGGISDAQFLALRRENSDLKRSVRELESLISQILSKRGNNRGTDARMAQIRKSLNFVLQQQALLPTV